MSDGDDSLSRLNTSQACHSAKSVEATTPKTQKLWMEIMRNSALPVRSQSVMNIPRFNIHFVFFGLFNLLTHPWYMEHALVHLRRHQQTISFRA